MQDSKHWISIATWILFFVSLLFLSYFNFSPSPNSLSNWIIGFLIACGLHYRVIADDSFQKNLRLIFIASISVKLIHTLGTPYLSNDIYRYIFDGHLLNHGISPYSISPLFSLTEFPDIVNPSLIEKINHPELSTIYLAVPEFIFGISAVTLPIRMIFLILEILFLGIIFKLNRERFPFFLLMSLHPLLIIETYSTGHFEFLMLYFVAMMYEFRDNITFQRLFYLLSVLTKGFSLFFLKMKRTNALILILAGILLFTNVMLITDSPSDGFSTYHKSFSFNNPIYDYLDYHLQEDYHDIQNTLPYQVFNKLLTLSIVLLISLISLWPFRKEDQFLGLFFSCVFIFGSSTIHPWYLLVLIYFTMQMNLKTLLFMTYTIFISYVVLIDFKSEGVWQLNPDFFWFIYAPFIIKLCHITIKRTIQLYKLCLQYTSKM